jgi:hypothetical protein
MAWSVMYTSVRNVEMHIFWEKKFWWQVQLAQFSGSIDFFVTRMVMVAKFTLPLRPHSVV